MRSPSSSSSRTAGRTTAAIYYCDDDRPPLPLIERVVVPVVVVAVAAAAAALSAATLLMFGCCHWSSLLPTTSVSITETANANATTTAAAAARLGVSRPAQYFAQQWVDHLDDGGGGGHSKYWGRTWSQRYYTMGDHFRKPGSPIFLILGGEGGIEPETGVLYPFITQRLAPLFGAYVLQPEHRFYGESSPISRSEIDDAQRDGDQDPRVRLLTPEQALHDAMRLVRYLKATRLRKLCSRDKFSTRYCPVIAVGGSYPGFLSAMARLVFPATVDVSYAASAPMKFYSQQISEDVRQYAYYGRIARTADRAFPGCASAVRKTMADVVQYYQLNAFQTTASKVGVCPGTVPSYVQEKQVWIDELVMMAGYSFANANMGYYPPSSEYNRTRLGRACRTFMGSTTNGTDKLSLEKLAEFFVETFGTDPAAATPCFNMSGQVPAGPRGTISSGDWSGVGTGRDGESWDFQTCTLLVEAIGFGADGDGNGNMFALDRNWNTEWLVRHCRDRFDVTPRPRELVTKWRFDDLPAAGASRILFTNGLADGWSVSGVQENASDDAIVALNFPNGSHHSDLSYYLGNDDDATDDVKAGRDRIQTVLARWLGDLPGGRLSSSSAAVAIV